MIAAVRAMVKEQKKVKAAAAALDGGVDESADASEDPSAGEGGVTAPGMQLVLADRERRRTWVCVGILLEGSGWQARGAWLFPPSSLVFFGHRTVAGWGGVWGTHDSSSSTARGASRHM